MISWGCKGKKHGYVFLYEVLLEKNRLARVPIRKPMKFWWHKHLWIGYFHCHFWIAVINRICWKMGELPKLIKIRKRTIASIYAVAESEYFNIILQHNRGHLSSPGKNKGHPSICWFICYTSSTIKQLSIKNDASPSHCSPSLCLTVNYAVYSYENISYNAE